MDLGTTGLTVRPFPSKNQKSSETPKAPTLLEGHRDILVSLEAMSVQS